MIFAELNEGTQSEIQALTSIWEASHFSRFAKRLADLRLSQLEDVSADTVAPNTVSARTNQFVIDVRTVVEKEDLGSVFVSLSKLRSMLNETRTLSPLLVDPLEKLKAVLEAQWSTLNTLIRQPTSIPTIQLFIRQTNAAQAILLKLSTYRELLTGAATLLEPQPSDPLQGLTIAFHFSADTGDLERFLNKLQAIREIYTQICLLLSIDERQSPIRIVKIESGSLFARFWGDNRTIGLMGWVIKNSIKYFYRQFTKEGKLASISPQIEVLREIVDLNTKLKGDGGTELSEALTKKTEEECAIALAHIAKKTRALIADETAVVIDGDLISLEETQRAKFIDMSKVHSLSETTDNSAP